MIGYLRTGSLQVKQKFTNDLEKAAKALRPPSGFANSSPYNPYVEVIEALKKFDSQPLVAGRFCWFRMAWIFRVESTLHRRLRVSICSVRLMNRSDAAWRFMAFTRRQLLAAANPSLAGNGQSSLLRLSNETGGMAFFQGSGAPVSFDPFIRELDVSLEKQAALTFLSTHLNKGFHRIEVNSSTPGVRVAYPSGYVR